MAERDYENVTYISGMDFLGSEEGRRFLEQKYRPRIDFLMSFFGSRFQEIKLLDVGIGYGMFLQALEREGIRTLFGMDPFERSIEIARRNTAAELMRGDITDDMWPVREGFFDAVTCMDVVEHLERPEMFFQKVKRYLCGGGVVIVTTPNMEIPYMMRRIPLIGFKDSNPTHINVRRPSYWKRLAVENGFEIVKSWKGEYLTHIRFLPKVLMLLCKLLRLDHRTIPVINSFEQSFCMVLRPLPAGGHAYSNGSSND
jgi:2-polyprenyl-3-methyl-5-hydroxy-6-metoxy-1,4-benzoquinol methylase